MTRLTTEMIKDTGYNLTSFNDLIKNQTGLNIFEIGCRAAGKNKDGFLNQMDRLSIAVVPVTAGLGTISQFSETVGAILSFVGFKTYLTDKCDIAGIGEAYAKKADLIFAADDNEFIAISTQCRKVVFNYAATAEAFVTAMERVAGGLKKKEVLVIGAGKVGKIAIETLLQKEAKVIVYDADQSKVANLKKEYDFQIINSLNLIGDKIKLIYDASPATDIISVNMINEDTFIACPGVPHGLEPKALSKIQGKNFIHDNLILGVITMALKAL